MADGDRGGEPVERVARLYGLLRPHLDERQRRLLLGAEALGLGRGGATVGAQATGGQPAPLSRGGPEAEAAPEPRGRGPWRGPQNPPATDPPPLPAPPPLL